MTVGETLRLWAILFAPAVFFATMGRGDPGRLSFWIGSMLLLYSIGVYTVVGIALLMFITMSGFHMIGMILFEWLP